jgi:ABC-type multidrug transport system fused ATPase/permease subunit
MVGIRFIKYRAKESEILQNILTTRKRQVHFHRKGAIVAFAGQLVGEAILPLLIVASIPVYVATTGGYLNASIIFPAIMYFQMLQKPLTELLDTVTQLSMGNIASKRITSFFATADYGKPLSQPNSENSVDLQNVSWQWPTVNGVDSFKLENITLSIPRGSKVAIIGTIGQGKSTFLHGILGEVEQSKGQVFVNGSIAYSPQEPWLLSGSIKENILFGFEEDLVKLNAVLKFSGLDTDVARMACGIETQLGENGISLSGGQRARVSLARALYRNADITLLDCPLAALDTKVTRKVCDGIFMGTNNRTLIMTTHKVFLLEKFDYVLVLKDGTIDQFGRYQELLETDGTLKTLVESQQIQDGQLGKEVCDDNAVETESVCEEDAKIENADDEGIIKEEAVNSGGITKETYWRLLQAFGPGKLIVLFFVELVFIGLSIASPYWVKLWSADVNGSDQSQHYLTIYIALNLALVAGIFALNLAAYFVGYGGACHIHNHALASVLRAQTTFFDSNPMGRILNRFSGDCGFIDVGLVVVVVGLSVSIGTLISALVLITFASPYLILLVSLVFLQYFWIYRAYIPTNRCFQRICSVSKSPLDTVLTTTLGGISCIRAFKEESSFVSNHRAKLDTYMANRYSSDSIDLWFSFRIQLASFLITLAISLLASQSRNLSTDFAASIGLALTYSSSFDIGIQALFSVLGVAEQVMTACERLLEYVHDLPLEPLSGHEPELDWPHSGIMEFKNVSIAYPTKPNQLVVKNLTITIQPGEKVGIVGRTGSGKSTILAALFRSINEFAGSIHVDNIGSNQLT